jgi:hypothetical protein
LSLLSEASAPKLGEEEYLGVNKTMGVFSLAISKAFYLRLLGGKRDGQHRIFDLECRRYRSRERE